MGEGGQRLPQAVVQLARQPAPLVLLHLPHRLGQRAEAALALDQTLEEALVLVRDLAHAIDDVVHWIDGPGGSGDPRLVGLAVRPAGLRVPRAVSPQGPSLSRRDRGAR